MKRHRKNQSRPRPPDDHFEAGPIEFARFGKVVIGRNRATSEQLEAVQAKMADTLPGIIAQIDTLVAGIAARIARLPPERLLQRAWWEFAGMAIGLGGKAGDGLEDGVALRMIDYVQSVIASVVPTPPCAEDVSEEDWVALKSNVRDLFGLLTGNYQIASTAHRRTQDPSLDMELEEFRFRAEAIWMNVRGERYQAHERQALLDVLMPHSDVLTRLFGIDAPTLIEELDKVLAKLTHGIGDAFNDLDRLQQDPADKLAEIAEKTDNADVENIRAKLFEDPEFAARSGVVAGEIFGLDLFDVGKITNLPEALLAELAWSPGEENEFFAPGEFSGWPLRIWPTMKRPFVRLQGRVLCFDFFTLFDNIYRVLQRLIFRLAPDYREPWNERQKAVSEALPFEYLEKLLPGVRVFRPVYYRWKVGAGPLQWFEADGLLLYEDHLFIVEVKAGAFTYTSPATDLQAHISSLEGLLLSPAFQGNRFLDFLESAPEVAIADAEHNEIGRLRRSEFRHVTICSVTLDPFTELAARAQHLRKIGVDVGQRPVWALSVDDLRVYADLFDNTLVFLHFVEQRIRASRSEFVDLNDEMDHLGLYLRQNNYSQYAAALVRGGKMAKLNFVGYRDHVDAYYSAIIRGDQPVLPRQEMPPRLAEIVSFLSESNVRGRSELASFLLDASGEFRRDLATSIDGQLRKNRELGRTLPLSTYGDMRLTVFVWSPASPKQAANGVEHTQVVMAANNETARPLVELEYTAEDALSSVHWQQVTLTGLSAPELDRVRAAGVELKKQRVAAVEKERKIGPNERCPCGSGRKYKRCHRA
jgi:preprotein translocase subunit SecA